MDRDISLLFTSDARRKYLNLREFERFLEAASHYEAGVITLAFTLALTGCRISEALSLSGDSLVSIPANDRRKALLVRSLKRIRKNNRKSDDDYHYRIIPVSERLTECLEYLAQEKQEEEQEQTIYFWSIDRTTAWRKIKSVMSRAGISGVKATPKGLRHSYGINNLQKGTPEHLVQRWMGHSSPRTTRIYVNLVGEEEWQQAECFFDSLPSPKISRAISVKPTSQPQGGHYHAQTARSHKRAN